MNWYNGTFNETKEPYPDKTCTPGETCKYITNAGLGSDGGGLVSPITFPTETDGESPQHGIMGSISYVPETEEYLLTFLGPSSNGSALFYSTLDATRYDLSNEDKWSAPKEITNSWESNSTTGSNSLWYSSFMSLNSKPGYLSTSGYVFSTSGNSLQQPGPGANKRTYISRAFTIEVAPVQPPDQPSILSPGNGDIGINLTPMLQSSVFSDPDSDNIHAASQWQITTTLRDYSSPVFDSGTDTEKLTSITIPAGTLRYATTYYWRVRYQDNHGVWSDWSLEMPFTTTTQAGESAGPPWWIWIVIGVGLVFVLIGGIVVRRRLVQRRV